LKTEVYTYVHWSAFSTSTVCYIVCNSLDATLICLLSQSSNLTLAFFSAWVWCRDPHHSWAEERPAGREWDEYDRCQSGKVAEQIWWQPCSHEWSVPLWHQNWCNCNAVSDIMGLVCVALVWVLCITGLVSFTAKKI